MIIAQYLILVWEERLPVLNLASELHALVHNTAAIMRFLHRKNKPEPVVVWLGAEENKGPLKWSKKRTCFWQGKNVFVLPRKKF